MICCLSVEDEKTSVKSPEKEILKKDLLELCKNNLSAQAANHAYNKFNNIINKNVKKFSQKARYAHYLKYQQGLLY